MEKEERGEGGGRALTVLTVVILQDDLECTAVMSRWFRAAVSRRKIMSFCVGSPPPPPPFTLLIKKKICSFFLGGGW